MVILFLSYMEENNVFVFCPLYSYDRIINELLVVYTLFYVTETRTRRDFGQQRLRHLSEPLQQRRQCAEHVAAVLPQRSEVGRLRTRRPPHQRYPGGAGSAHHGGARQPQAARDTTHRAAVSLTASASLSSAATVPSTAAHLPSATLGS